MAGHERLPTLAPRGRQLLVGDHLRDVESLEALRGALTQSLDRIRLKCLEAESISSVHAHAQHSSCRAACRIASPAPKLCIKASIADVSLHRCSSFDLTQPPP